MNTKARSMTRPRSIHLYSALALCCALIVFLGFAPTFYLNAVLAHRRLDLMRTAHGTVFSLWLVMLVAQTSLVARGRVDLHRRLGVAGGLLASLMVVLGVAMAIHGARYGLETPDLPPVPVFLVVPLFDMLVFASLIGAALWYRRRPDLHKRLMIMATIALLPAAFARMPLNFIGDPLLRAFALGDAALLTCVACDVVAQRRLHRVWIWGGLWIVLSLPLRMAVAGTPSWQAFAGWLIGP